MSQTSSITNSDFDDDLLLVELSEQLETNPSSALVEPSHSTQLHLILQTIQQINKKVDQDLNNVKKFIERNKGTSPVC